MHFVSALNRVSHRHVIFAAFLSALAMGLSASSVTAGPRGSGAAAKLTLTRTSSALYMGLPATVRVNGRQVASLWRGEAATVAISAGTNRVTVDGWSAPGSWMTVLNARPGGRYAIEISPRGDSLAPAMLFGVAGALVDAAANKNKGGAFQLRVISR